MLFFQVLGSALFGVFRYSGRSDRLEHWAFSFLTAVSVLALVIFRDISGIPYTGGIFLGLFFGAIWLLLAHIALFVRRLHDQGRSGLFMLIPFTALTVFVTGWLGKSGYIMFETALFVDWGYLIQRVGQSLIIISITMLASVFIGEGDNHENKYGDPVF
jgi:uncharacterized membrane protein YhaH (DUF805 family)